MVKGAVCKTAMHRFDSDRRLHELGIRIEDVGCRN